MNSCKYCHTIDSAMGGFVHHCMYANRICIGDDCERYDDGDINELL